jgi:hypothetical protein
MRTRIIQMGAAIAAVAIALMVARTEAFASDKESCSTTTTDVSEGPSSDGAVATCDAETGGPNGATAHSSGKDANATSEASGGSDTSASAKGGDSDSTAEAGGGSMAVSSAKGDDADATAEASSGSDAKATAKGSHSDATAEAGGGSMAVSSAKGDNADATAEAGAGSSAQATASGDGSDAEAVAEETGSDVTALATKGSTAIGSDTAAPTCTPKHGGKAVVTSPMGNCHCAPRTNRQIVIERAPQSRQGVEESDKPSPVEEPDGGSNDAQPESTDRGGRRGFDGRDRRRVRHVQRISNRAPPVAGSVVERALVPAISLCSDQLHRQLDLRNLRRDRLMDRRLLLSALAGSIRLEDNPRRSRRSGKSSSVIVIKLSQNSALSQSHRIQENCESDKCTDSYAGQIGGIDSFQFDRSMPGRLCRCGFRRHRNRNRSAL